MKIRISLNIIIVILLLVVVSFSTAVYEYRAFVDTEVISYLSNHDYAEVIIKLNSNNADTILDSLHKNEFNLFNIFPMKNGFFGTITKDGFYKLLRNRNVKSIYMIRVLNITLAESIPLINSDDILQIQINNENITGNNETICIVDSGINYTHSDLGGCFGSGCKVLDGYDYVNNDGNPMDDNGHGTHVSGIVSSNGTIRGVAQRSNLVALKACSSAGNCLNANIISSMQWCNLNSSVYDIKIISISIGDGGEYPPNCPTWLDDEINDAHNKNISVIIASGNSGHKSGVSYPACSPNATSVGATYDKKDMSVTWTAPDPDCTDYPTRVDQIGCGTNRANILDLLAPGGKINSTYLSPYNYIENWGTSMAAPHVAGVAALMLQAANLSGISITPAEIESIMKRTGKPIYDSATGLTFTRLDAYRSVMAVLYDVFVNDLKEVYSDNQGRKIFGFSVYNDFGSNVTVNYTFDFGDSNRFTSNNFNMSSDISNETLVYVEHVYNSIGNFNVTTSIKSSQGSVANQTIQASVNKPNLRVSDLSILNSTGLSRVFEFEIQNNASVSYDNVTWQLNITSEQPLNSTQMISLTANETVFVYVYYLYSEAGSRNITATADYDGRHSEFNEIDNSIMLSDG